MKKIQLYKNKDVVLVDDEDYEMLSKYKWSLRNNNTKFKYANTSIRKNNKWINKMMHHFLIDLPNDMCVDHIDRNGLNNQKNNLRVVTYHQNMMNKSKYKNSTSIYKGVHRVRNKWRSSIRFNKKLYHLGYFINEIDAAIAYNKKAKELFKEYACLNEV